MQSRVIEGQSIIKEKEKLAQNEVSLVYNFLVLESPIAILNKIKLIMLSTPYKINKSAQWGPAFYAKMWAKLCGHNS